MSRETIYNVTCQHVIHVRLSPDSCPAGARSDVGLQVCYLMRPARGDSSYVGWTWRVPFYREDQHNGRFEGGTARLADRRPWRLVAYVYNFPGESVARSFEAAWIAGLCSGALRSAPRFRLAQGCLGKMQVLAELLRCRRFFRFRLHVHLLVRDREQASAAELAFEARLEAALQGWWHVTRGSHIRDA